uniref:Cyclin-like domain-containing protein n=1 Tax=Panagrolaimus sp. JU765 TaxID=591449 RepID=A0AC34Q9Y1_9BILA
MYATSTQKKYWTFSVEELENKRVALNKAYIDRHRRYLESEEELALFPTSEDERQFCRIVADTGIRFGKEFQPALPPAVRWTALMYYKRFYLTTTPSDFTPKFIMMTCYFLAAKVDEFNIRTQQFVRNLQYGEPDKNAEIILKTEPKIMEQLDYQLTYGEPDKNAEIILKTEPKIMEQLDYQLTVHTPFRPFEGHLVELKTKLPLIDFDLEQIRPPAMKFFDLALIGDVMLLHPPTHIALAAVQYALDELAQSHLLKDFLYKFLDLDPWTSKDEEKQQVDKLLRRIEEVKRLVITQSNPMPQETYESTANRMKAFTSFLCILEKRMSAAPDTPMETGGMSDDSD